MPGLAQGSVSLQLARQRIRRHRRFRAALDPNFLNPDIRD